MLIFPSFTHPQKPETIGKNMNEEKSIERFLRRKLSDDVVRKS